MSLATADEVYEQVVEPLPAAERLRLVELIARSLTDQVEDMVKDMKVKPARLGWEQQFQLMAEAGDASLLDE